MDNCAGRLYSGIIGQQNQLPAKYAPKQTGLVASPVEAIRRARTEKVC